ncbi:MAG: ECF transporter S component, partial [Firmicutes bacterium]|nr:ECF transporter S component [Bacillota bacterium]
MSIDVKRAYTKKLVYTAVFTALGVLLPFVTAHGFGISGGAFFLPMHIPVLLCGLLCGAYCGAACGLLAPCLSCLITSMPPMYPMLPIMAVELPIYGAVAGLLYSKLKLPLFLSLPSAMIAGRCGYGLMFALLFAFDAQLKALTVWAAVATGLPGIAVQLAIIPMIVHAADPKAKDKIRSLLNARAFRLAKRKIEAGKATLIVVKKRTVVYESSYTGV